MFYVPRAMMHRFVQGHVSGAFLDVLIYHSFELSNCNSCMSVHFWTNITVYWVYSY